MHAYTSHKVVTDHGLVRSGVMDSMMEVLESYANHLEEKVVERTGELDTANKALENLLHQANIKSRVLLITSTMMRCVF